MTEEWPLVRDKGGRKDFDSEVMFELRFEIDKLGRKEGKEQRVPVSGETGGWSWSLERLWHILFATQGEGAERG